MELREKRYCKRISPNAVRLQVFFCFPLAGRRSLKRSTRSLRTNRCLALLSSGLSHYKGTTLLCAFQGRNDVDCVTDPAGMGLPMALEHVKFVAIQEFLLN